MSDENLDKKEKIMIDLEDASKAVSDTYSLYTAYEVKKQPVPEEDIAPENIDTTATKPGKVDSIKSLKPELQKPIKKLLASVPKEQIKKLINPSLEQKSRLFNDKGGSNTFGNLSDKEKSALMEKMDSWKVNEEVAEINAAISVSWLNNVANLGDKKKSTGKLNNPTGKLNDNNG